MHADRQCPYVEATWLADADVVDACLQFHARTCANTSERVLSNIAIPGYLDARERYARLEHSEGRMRFDASDLVALDSDHAPASLQRSGSPARFAARRIDARTLADFVHASFFTRAFDGRRPTPSAGALYPIEVLLVPIGAGVESLDARVYHVLAKTHALEPLDTFEAETFREVVYAQRFDDIDAPSLALVYVMHLARCVIKYRYRGYRHALMEVGCMVQQADLVARTLGLASLPWSAFSDHALTRHLRLNPRLFTPLCMQLVGVADASRSDTSGGGSPNSHGALR